MTIRTRFAPSPTGHVHIGNIRVAIYNWLYARHMDGQFLLRIEDTDRERSTQEATQKVLDAMAWLGMDYDEEPVYQSTRQEAHLAAAEDLLAKGLAYKEDKGGTGKGECVIFKMPGTDISYVDEVKGEMCKAGKDLQDFVIVRSNGTPVFHLANVVDDIHMGITHVIRGDDHVENTFKHIALYQALGAELPTFSHLPMIVNHQGKPYSKRDGDAYIGDFKEKGFLAETVFNYLTLLGWSPGDDREVMTCDEIVKAFELDRVKSSPAQMDLKKMLWMNGEYMRKLPRDVYAKGCQDVLEARGLWRSDISETYFTRVLEVMEERIKLFTDIVDQAAYFFTEDYAYDEKAVRKRLLKEGALDNLKKIKERFEACEPFNVQTTEAVVQALAEELESGVGPLVNPLRVAVSGMPGGPGLYDMLDVLGKERVLQRIERTLTTYSKGS